MIHDRSSDSESQPEDAFRSLVLLPRGGGGVVVGSELIVTTARAFSCVADKLAIFSADGQREFAPVVLGYDAPHDLVLIKAAGLSVPALELSRAVGKLGESMAVAAREDLRCHSAPARLREDKTGPSFHYFGLRMGADAYAFRRGSAVLRDDALYGVVVAESSDRDGTLLYCAPASIIERLIQNATAIPLETFKESVRRDMPDDTCL